MSTTRSTSDSGAYTVIGGETLDRGTKGRPGLSIVLLNRDARPFRNDLFDELCKIGARDILSIESTPPPGDIETLTRRHPELRFLLFASPSNPGARIDAAIQEALSDHVFVLQSDMGLKAASISSRVFAKIAERDRICTVPVFRDVDDEVLPTAVGPLFGPNGRFDVQPILPPRGEAPTLFPWDYAGIYKRDRHLSVGGFDARIAEPWWQKMEYGLRCWLWGEEIRVHPALRVDYQGEMPPEDSSLGPGYRRFFLKTLAVIRRRDAGRLPRSRWKAYRRGSGESAGRTRDAFRDIRSWVDTHRYRYVRDAAELTELWDWNGDS